jgi:NAD(P)-dependent dehydrogenase (short-subunit alcohol dehydrogenase family)
MSKNAVITGAGTGVGAAVAIALAREGWRVALLGRRREPLEAVAANVTGALVVPCDVGDSSQVDAMAKQVLAEFGDVEVLVNAAGTNVPQRALEVLSLADYHEMMNANLNGAFYCVQAFLPRMRQQGSGTIINIISEAGKAASPKAGPGYVISKFGMAGLTSAINAEERARGIRACSIFPGDIDTPILDKRPAPPDAAARARMMLPEDIAACAMLAINLPARAIVEELIVRPR